ncbi:MAG: mechanosensitive ion channel protein [Candidatus Wallbacteria bacterium HGW-Wallbacteria-1]|jgi:small conductance mechanosensitive channel|uniref:Mechanosensitive ion channel protein n=1 Tax=Candidatus Wallbacteria bacterium HGW-Wallbacteria-1 TaxID=2013854 RepID=A0A2N1PJB0_9BACT|nr:MAG: mechanosensitive ion channel protein [Candidatus Wallbacteria bacterium HGW-Wallbacteria-1]
MNSALFESIFNRLKPLLLHYGLRIIGAVMILVLGSWLVNILLRLIARGMEKANVETTLAGFVKSIAHAGLLALVWIVALGNLGVQTTSFIAILGAAGLAIGLALQGSLSNFGSGALLILFKPFKAGDYIEAAGTAGTVREVGIFTTTVVTPDNKLVVVPNSSLTGSNITNYSATGTRRVEWIFGIGYGDDMAKAKKIVMDILAAETRGLADPAPMVAIRELGDSSVNLVARLWVNSADYWNVSFDTTEKVKTAFDAENITIPYPQRDVHLFNEK